MLTSSFSRLVLALLAWCLLMLALAGAYFYQWLSVEQRLPASTQVFTVEKGEGLGQVAARLEQQGALRWPLVWRLYSRFMQPDTIKAGEYALGPYESPRSLLNRLQGGEVISYNVTFAEGLSLKEWRSILANEPKLKQETLGLTAKDIALLLDIPHENPEGWFFPDTYRFEKGDSDFDILTRAHSKMSVELANLWARRKPNLPYDSAYEALIMASIVEKETGVPSERAAIAGVFVRRLERRMRLQTDPTVIYGMGDNYQGNIRKRDLQTPTPYNTYVIKGLPPTPIANPGKEAIAAALNPGDGTALYFVAKGDGSHYFSSSLTEHNKAVAKYQLKRKSDYTSVHSPKPVEARAKAADTQPQTSASSEAANAQ